MAGGFNPFGSGSIPSFTSMSLDDSLNPNLGLARAATPAPSLTDAINTIPAGYGVDPAYIRKMAVAESGGNLGAQAATSSASGPYQIIGSTADSLGLDRADRSDPTKATHAISQFTADNAAGLQKAGFDTSHGNLYLSHFAGLGGARSVLGADPSTPVSQILPASSIEANSFLRGMSAGDLRAWADRKMSGGGAMEMPASAGGAARPAGFGLQGAQQGAAPAGGAEMSVPDAGQDTSSAVPSGLASAIRGMAGSGGGKAPGQGQQAVDDIKPFSFSPMKLRAYRPIDFSRVFPGTTRGSTR